MISFTATNLSEVVAMARAHNVRVVQGVLFSEHGEPSARFNTSRLEDPSYTTGWIRAAVGQVVANNVDGFNLDVEHFHSPTARTKACFTAFVCALQAGLQGANRSLFSVDTQVWGETDVFDLRALSACSDYLLPCAYDLVGKDGNASSNSPLTTVRKDLGEFYLRAGVPPQKVILGLPAYGYAFPCTSEAAGSAAVWPRGDSAAPPCHVMPVTPLSTWQVGLGTVVEKLQTPGVVTVRGRDDVTRSGSPWMEYNEEKHHPKGRRQVWYEDAESLKLKSGLAWSAGLGGVALWTAEALWNIPSLVDAEAVYVALEPQEHSLY